MTQCALREHTGGHAIKIRSMSGNIWNSYQVGVKHFHQILLVLRDLLYPQVLPDAVILGTRHKSQCDVISG